MPGFVLYNFHVKKRLSNYHLRIEFMRNFLFLLLFSLSFATYSQQSTGDGMIMKKLAQAPDSVFRSLSSYSGFLKNSFTNNSDILKAIYFWVAKSVLYDVENLSNINFEENPRDLIERTFRTKKAICQGYAELFNDLCRRSGIQSYVVHGYTKQEGEVKNAGHAWVVTNTGNKWYFFDPTWGAGYVLEGKFVKSFSSDYFMVPPETFILSHIPFDPMWQCLDYPISIQDFYFGASTQKEGAIFNYSDSIHKFYELSLINQYEITLRRIEQNGIKNNLIRDYAAYLKQIIENDRLTKIYEYQSAMIDKLNEAAGHYNDATNLFNRYISYFNRQFTPGLPDVRIRQMIDTCDVHLKIAKQLLVQVDPFDQKIRQNLDQLKSVIRELQSNINEQKFFVTKFLKTPKGNRASLFKSRK